MTLFLSGLATALAAVSGVFFLRFWRRTGDQFFLLFALAFFSFGVERCVLSATGSDESPVNFIYLIRLAAFALILLAIVVKNRRSNGQPPA